MLSSRQQNPRGDILPISFAQWFESEDSCIAACAADDGSILYMNPAGRAAMSDDAALVVPLGQLMGEALLRFRDPCAYTSLQTRWGVYRLCLEAYPLYVEEVVRFVLFRWENVWQTATLMRAIAGLEKSLAEIEQTVLESPFPRHRLPSFSYKDSESVALRGAYRSSPSFAAHRQARMKGAGSSSYRLSSE